MANTKIIYDDRQIAEATNPVTIVMKTKGKEMLTDVEIVGESEIPAGGEPGQVLTRTSDGGVAWGDSTIIHWDDDMGSLGIMTGATDSKPGAAGLVPPPAAGDHVKFLRGDGTWQEVSGGGGGGGSTATIIHLETSTPKNNTVLSGVGAENGFYINYKATSVTSSGSSSGQLELEWTINNTVVKREIVDCVDYDIFQSMEEQSFNVWSLINQNGVSNVIRLKVIDDFQNIDTQSWTVTVVSYGLLWNLPDISNHGSSASLIRFTTIGSSSAGRELKVKIDNNAWESYPLSSGETTKTVTVSARTHGTHTIRGKMTFTVNGVSGETEELIHVGIWTSSGNNTPIIAVDKDVINTTQYSVVPIQYMIVNPADNGELTTVHLVYGSGPNDFIERSIGSEVQTWNYTATTVTIIKDEEGQIISNNPIQLRIEIPGTNVSKSITVNCSASDIDLQEPITDGLVMLLDPSGHSNDEAGIQSNFGYTDGSNVNHPLTFSSNFDWINGGFVTDDEGSTAFVIRRGCYVELDRSFFHDNQVTHGGSSEFPGEEIKIVFRVRNVADYDAVALDCYSTETNGSHIGLQLQAQQAILSDGSAVTSIPYCEESKIELDVNIGKLILPNSTELKYSMFWLEGIPSGVSTYANNWEQGNSTNVRIGSAYCDVWIYLIKMYNHDLSRREIVQNYIADSKVLAERISREKRNAIYDNSGDIDINALKRVAPDLRILLIEADRFTTSKSDEVPCTVSLFYGGRNEFYATNAQMFVQGTTSANYGKSAFNLDLNFENSSPENDGSWIDSSGEPITKYAMTANDIAVNYFNIKLNVASSENANNVILADDYNVYEPESARSAARRANPRVRDTVKGYPCAVFFKYVPSETNNHPEIVMGPANSGARTAPANTIVLYGVGDMNNSKKNFNVFGQDRDTYGEQCCIEFLNNASDQCRFVSDDLSNENWDKLSQEDVNAGKVNNFEFRFPKKPKTVAEEEALLGGSKLAFQTMLSWVVSTNTNAIAYETDQDAQDGGATPLSSPYYVSDTQRTYYYDTKEYRRAKFKNEVNDYFSLSSLLFHYLFTTYHCMIDNRAKNTFFSYELYPDVFVNDVDPAGRNGYRWNVCKDYDNDTAEGINNEGDLVYTYGLEDTDPNVFNADNSVLWCNVRDCFISNLETMFVQLAGQGAWSANRILSKFTEHQSARPEALVVEDMWNKYMLPGDELYRQMLQGTKADQRRQFEIYQEIYMSSKYYTNEITSSSNSILVRGNTPDNVAVPPSVNVELEAYTDCYLTVYYGSSYEKKRAKKGDIKLFTGAGQTSFHDTEIYLYPANCIADTSTLATLYPNTFKDHPAGFGIMPRLRQLLLGAASPYSTTSLTNFNIKDSGSDNMYEVVDVRGNASLTGALDLRRVHYLRELRAGGSGYTEVYFANGAPVESVALNSPTKVVACNLVALSEGALNMGFSELSLIYVDNVKNVNWLDKLSAANAPKLTNGCILNVDCEVEPETLLRLFDYEYNSTNDTWQAVPENRQKMHGVNVSSGPFEDRVYTNDNNSPFKITGVCYVLGATQAQQTAITAAVAERPGLTVQFTGDPAVSYTVTFVARDNTGSPITVSTQAVRAGRSATDPRFLLNTLWDPEGYSDNYWDYTFQTWDTPFVNVQSNLTVTAEYSQQHRVYQVNFYSNADKSQLLQSVDVPTVGNIGDESYGNARYTSSVAPTVSNGAFWGGWKVIGTDPVRPLVLDGIDQDMDLCPFEIKPKAPSASSVTPNAVYLYSDDPNDTSKFSLSELFYVLHNINTYYAGGAGSSSTAPDLKINLHDKIKVIPIAGDNIFTDTYFEFELAGVGGYYKESSTGAYTNAVFCLREVMDSKIAPKSPFVVADGTSGGWRDSYIRKALNVGVNHQPSVYDSFSQHWHALIKKVDVKSNVGLTYEQMTRNFSDQDENAPEDIRNGIVLDIQLTDGDSDIVRYLVDQLPSPLHTVSQDYLFLLSNKDVGAPIDYYSSPGGSTSFSPRSIYLGDNEYDSLDNKKCLDIFLYGFTTEGSLNRMRWPKGATPTIDYSKSIRDSSYVGAVDWALRSPHPGTYSYRSDADNPSWCAILGLESTSQDVAPGKPAQVARIKAKSPQYIIFAFCV